VHSGAAVRPAAPEDGFTLVEVLAAMFLFVILSTATAAILIQGMTALRENADRVTAANIARSEIEYLRDLARLDPDIIPIGQFTGAIPPATAPEFVSLLSTDYVDPILLNTDYEINTTSQWVDFASLADPSPDASACDAEYPVATYLRVVVTVSSPTLKEPASLQTNITQQRVADAVSEDAVGAAAISVVNSATVPVSDVVVTFTDAFHQENNKSALTTGFDGCLFLPSLVPTASLVVTISRDGYVASPASGTSKTLAISDGVVTKVTFEYAAAATLRFTGNDPDHPLPADLAVQWKVKGTGGSIEDNAITDVVTGLWPGDEVEAWAGFCPDADPLFTASARSSFALSPGATTVAQLPVVPLRIRGLLPDEPVTAIHADDCDSTLALGRSAETGPLLVGVPYGDRKFRAAGENITPENPLSPPAPGVSAVVVVITFTQDEIKATPSPTATDSGSPSPSPTEPEPTPTEPEPTPTPSDSGSLGEELGP
jgi:prepilin-type N-terminal cleavage/methylation domain-containing protein